MVWFKATMLSAVLVSAVAVTANAADPAPPTTANPPQVAANPGMAPAVVYSSTRTPGPKAGPSNWIPSPYAAPTTPDSGGNYYSKKGFGPGPN